LNDNNGIVVLQTTTIIIIITIIIIQAFIYDKLILILLKTILEFVLALRKSHEFKRNSFLKSNFSHRE
jgi:hypothetical protein